MQHPWHPRCLHWRTRNLALYTPFMTVGALLAVSQVRAQLPITSLFNTGAANLTTLVYPIDIPGSLLGDFVDSHYTMVSNNFTPPPASSSATYVETEPYTSTVPGNLMSGWVSSSLADWIGPDNVSGDTENDGTTGDYTVTYQTTFTLPPGVTSVDITGNWATDNQGDSIKLNGYTIPGVSITGPYGFEALHGFTLPTTASYYNTGVNYLDFTWENTSDPAGGLLVAMTGTYTTTPEPGALVLLATGCLSGIGLLLRRRRTRI